MEKLKSKSHSILLSLFVLVMLISTACSKDEINTNNAQIENESLVINEQNSFTDKEIFEGLFFGTGSVAKLIPSIDNEYVEHISKAFTVEENKAIDDFKNDIYSQLKKNKPTEFSSFISALKSGDNELISQQIINFSKIYYSELKTSEKYGKYFVKAEKKLSKIDKSQILDKNGVFDKKKLEELLVLNDDGLVNDDGMTSEEMITTLGAAPVICLTMIVWNYGVVVNAAAAVNVAIGVNVVVLCYFGVGDDCFSERRSDDDKTKVLEREMLINEISVNLYE